MDLEGFSRRKPYLFSFLLLFALLVTNGTAVTVAEIIGAPLTSAVIYSELALAIILLLVISRLRWWKEIGFKKPERSKTVWLFAPAFLLVLGNLTFGIGEVDAGLLLSFAVLAALSGFVEEVIFRGLMLRALIVRGEWTALVVTSGIFGVAHAGNVLAGSEPLYVMLQLAYSLAIGFGFGAMALRGGLLWPLIIAHGLGNFIALINADEYALGHLVTVVIVYIVIFTGYGVYLMKSPRQALTVE